MQVPELYDIERRSVASVLEWAKRLPQFDADVVVIDLLTSDLEHSEKCAAIRAYFVTLDNLRQLR
jgi:hypothetical protein